MGMDVTLGADGAESSSSVNLKCPLGIWVNCATDAGATVTFVAAAVAEAGAIGGTAAARLGVAREGVVDVAGARRLRATLAEESTSDESDESESLLLSLLLLLLLLLLLTAASAVRVVSVRAAACLTGV